MTLPLAQFTGFDPMPRVPSSGTPSDTLPSRPAT